MAVELTPGQKRWARKEKYKVKFEKLLREYTNILVVGIDNVGSLQMQKVRIALRGKAVLMMGKNTLMRMIIRELVEASNDKRLESLLPFVKGNMGLVFTNDDLQKVRQIITEYKVPAGAKSGTFAPTDVFVPPGATGLYPGQTGFFQALNIATKIVRGSIEIVNQVHLIKKGDKITSSAVALLAKLDIKPFFYGIVVLHVYEKGAVYPASVLDVTQDELLAKFVGATNRLRALSLAARWPSELTLSYHMASGFRKLLALSLATNYKIDAVEKMAKAAAAAPAAKPAGGGGGDKKEGKDGGKDAKAGGKGGKDKEKEKPAAKPAEPEPEPDEGGDVGMPGLFD